MAVTSTRTIVNRFSEDIDLYDNREVENLLSPGVVDLIDLELGANTITPPEGSVACTIIPPAANVILITLKGVTGDTGIVLHPTGPTSIALNSDESTFVLTAASAIVGVRLIWS